MTQEYITLLILGILSNPILWILSIVIASNIIPKPYEYKLLYLSISGLIMGFIALFGWKARGEIFTSQQTIIIISLSFIIMIASGSLFYFIFNLFKSRS